MIEIEFDDGGVAAGLDRLGGLLDDLTPVMQEIGEYMTEATKRRFREGTGPDGIAWAAKSAATLAAYSRRGERQDPRPLWGPTGMLAAQIFHEAGPDRVEVGSNRIYAAMMQFGGTKAAFPHLWGDIPARPFLGLSEDDRAAILEAIDIALGAALGDPGAA
ncbi:MAG: phage virion morphogenesis protein [Alphaproteobacteria bacterium]